MDSWQDKEGIKKITGYLAGEIALPNDMTGIQYLKLISKMRRMADVICAVVFPSLYKSQAYCLNLSFLDLIFWYIKITTDAIIVIIA